MRDLTVLANQLTAWLKVRIPQAVDLRLENLAYPFGAGQSHETILFDTSSLVGGQRMEQGFVLRIKPTWHTVYPDDLFTEQFRLMQLLHRDGPVRVARPMWCEPDPALLGAPFFVMEKLRGRVAVSVPPYPENGWVKDATPAQRARLWENGVRQLAAIQTVPRTEMSFLARAPGARDGLAQEWHIRRLGRAAWFLAGAACGAGSLARTLARKPVGRAWSGETRAWAT